MPMRPMVTRLAVAAATATILVFVAPLTAETQTPGKVFRLSILSAGSAIAPPPSMQALRQGLRDLGWVEGQNIVIDYRFAD